MHHTLVPLFMLTLKSVLSYHHLFVVLDVDALAGILYTAALKVVEEC